LREAFEDVETAARGGAKRYLSCRGCYVYRVRTDDGIEFRYVGESVDVERRINDHVTALIGDGRADTIQRGHALVREAAARKGDDLAESFDFRAWVLAGYDEANAVELAKTYVETCASPRQPPPSILEVARAIAGAGFFQEAVWTAYYGTLHGHTASEGVIGMNFSQPGVCHPSQGDGVDSTDGMMSWDAMKALIKSGKSGKTTKATGSHERSKEKEFKCAVCYKEISLLTKRRFRPDGDGGGRVCAGCYSSAWRAKQPAFTCRKCDTKIAPGKRSYRDGEGGGGRVCNACYNSAFRAKQQKR